MCMCMLSVFCVYVLATLISWLIGWHVFFSKVQLNKMNRWPKNSMSDFRFGSKFGSSEVRNSEECDSDCDGQWFEEFGTNLTSNRWTKMETEA